MSFSSRSQVHIDLIEDNPGDALLISMGLKGLESLTVTVQHFPHPQAFFAQFNGPPLPQCSLLLTDFSMPFMTGLEVAQRLREAYSAAELPVFLTTGGLLTRADILACQEAGVSGIIAKPGNHEQWAMILEREMLPTLAAFGEGNF